MTTSSRLNDWLDRIQRRHSVGIELGLERCAAVWKRMGRPSPARRIVIVAGTNGKGSTVAGIEAGLSALGQRVACYTSPHLLRYNERVRIDGADAGDDAIIAGFEAVDAALDDTPMTFFEFSTLAAFATMARAELDYAVLEVGLGGRLDAVNIIDAEVAVITPIGLDHQAYLGDDRESIGREKAGVMRSGQTVVCSDRQPPESLFAAAADADVRLIRIGADFDVSLDTSAGASTWRYFFADRGAPLPIAMPGNHQADNLAASLTAVLMCEKSAHASLEPVAAAVGACRVRGRLEQLRDDPPVIIDVGHNPLAAQVIRDHLEALGIDHCRAVLGMLNDKDAGAVVNVLSDRVVQWYCAGLTGPRGQTGESLAGKVRGFSGAAPVLTFQTVAAAVDAARHDAGGSGVVLVFGSFHTAGEAIAHLEGGN